MPSQNFKLMADLMKILGHTDLLQGNNQKHVEKIIPERVFLFLSLLFEGMYIWSVWWRTYWNCYAMMAIKT